MKVILLEDVKSLGKKGDIVNVSDGYARNMILPKKLGVEATSKNMNDLKLQNQHADKVAKENLEAAKALAEEIATKQVTVKIKTGEGGKTFGSSKGNGNLEGESNRGIGGPGYGGSSYQTDYAK